MRRVSASEMGALKTGDAEQCQLNKKIMERRQQYLIYICTRNMAAFTHIRIESPVTFSGDRSCGTFIVEPECAVNCRVRWLTSQIHNETHEIKNLVGVRGERRQKRKNVDLVSSLGQQFKPTQPAGPPLPHLLTNNRVQWLMHLIDNEPDEFKAAVYQQFADAWAQGV